MAFPSSPIDGQQYTQNGFIYQYVAAINLWKKIGTVSSSSNTANVNVLTANTANVTSLTAESAYIAALIANNTLGNPGQILVSNGTGIYWANSDGFGFTGSRGYDGSIGGLGYTGSIGFTGSIGATGASGTGGYQGSIGDTGYRGSVGASGTAGVNGYQGSLGDTGYQGSAGTTGVTGFQGSVGSTGTTGATGFQGSVGLTGLTGATGFQGSQGESGFKGSFGDIGYQGSVGSSGNVGFQGSTGSAGATGFQGSVGSIGATGAIGFQGSQGESGFKGSFGDIGYQGSVGSLGNVGYQGSVGSLGNVGYQGSVGSTGATGATGYQGSQGDSGFVGSAGAVGFQGSSGGIGFQGSSGTSGASGTTGFQGSVGSTGNQGAVGYQGSFGFQGSFGDTGYFGSTGNQGITGFQGSAGNTGFTGSVGNTGFQGSVGSQGPQGGIGYTGSIGNTGFQGSTGFVGSTGSGFTGSTGFTGSKGDQGVRGYTGSAAEFAGGYVGSVSATSLSTTSVTSNSGVIDLLTSQNVTVVQGISVGNTTVNTSISATQIFSGNTFANATITPSSINVTNSISNSTITSQIVFVGNTVANASFNLIGGTATFSASRLSVNGNGVVIIQTSSDHGLSTLTGVFGTLSNFDKGWLNYPRILLSNTPTPNTISFTLGSGVLGNALKINAVKRVNGLMIYETVLPHNLLVNDVINVTGTPSSIESGVFNVTNGIVNTVPTSNTFTIYDSARSNKNIISSNSVTVSTTSLAASATGFVYLTINLGFPHNLKINELVNISGVTGVYGGSTTITGSVLGRTFNLNGARTITGVTANTFQVLAFQKTKNSTAVPGGSNTLTYTGTFNVSSNNDIANTKITTSSYSSLPIINNIPIANGTITYTVPIFINVGNTVSATKITPTSIFVGDLTGNSVIIDSAGTRYKKTGSILQTTVDGAGFGVATVLDDGGAVDPEASAFIANTSVISIGNTTSTTVITQEAVSTANVFVGQENTRVSITQDTISIEDNTSSVNTTITNTLASFPNDLAVGATLFVNAVSDATGSLGTSGQVLTSNGSASYWDTPTGGGGSSVTVSSTVPSSPSPGDLWWNTIIGSLYIYYNDGNTSQWVEASPGGAGGNSSGASSGRSFTHAWFFGG